VLALKGNVYLGDFTRTSFGLEVPKGYPNEIEASPLRCSTGSLLKARLAIHRVNSETLIRPKAPGKAISAIPRTLVPSLRSKYTKQY
jgi:hypothetical protein